jgi:hypothetical protein
VPTDSSTVVLGLLADPGLPSELAGDLAGTLPDLLARDTDGRARWRVETATQALTLDEHGTLPMVEIGQQALVEHGWDLVVLVTDLPRRAGTQPILSDYGLDAGVALVSLPALGGIGLRRQARNVVVHLVADHLATKPLGDGDGNGRDRAASRGHRPLALAGEVEHITSEDEGIDMHLALAGAPGRLRLLVGMVVANRPWRLVPSLSPALASAGAGAAFGVFYSNIWQLANGLSTGRLALINVLAVLALITWLIIDNSLWERPSNRQLREEVVLYNAATALSITIGVICAYGLLYVVTLVSALVVISPDYLSLTLKQRAGFAGFAIIAWLAASMGTIAGALGSGLASEDAVRRAAYSKREQERRVHLHEDGSPS